MKTMMNEYEYDDSDGDSDDYSYVDNDEYFIISQLREFHPV
jgi:hypothetical protein